MTTANKITMVRIAMIPFFVVFALMDGVKWQALALVLFCAASLTDFLDGYVARKYNQVTDFGKFVDPLADKLLVTAALVIFVGEGLLASWMVFLILAREFIITSLRNVAAAKGQVMAASWSGKVKTASTMICLCLMHLWGEPLSMNTLDWVCVIVIAATTLYSGVEYFVKNKDVLNWNK